MAEAKRLKTEQRKPLNLGDVVPNFKAETSTGPIDFHEFIGDSWVLFFSHPSDYTPVCTTELGVVARLVGNGEFSRRGVKVLALSCNDVQSHLCWIRDIQSSQNVSSFSYPIIADVTRELAVLFGMLDADDQDKQGIPLTCRAVFVIGPDKKLKLQLLYPNSTGRNFEEIVRAIDSLLLTAKYHVGTPANWKDGDRCLVRSSLSDEEAKEEFPKGFQTIFLPSGKNYMRITPQPNTP